MSGPDPWARLRRHTAARIALGRVGDGLPTGPLLDFQLAHARARDAVHAPLDLPALRGAYKAARLGPPLVEVRSAAPDRPTYLQRPDLGRRLAEGEASRLERLRAGEERAPEVVFVLADGLSARATAAHAVPTLAATLAGLPDWRVGPVVVATQARVALGDEIGAALGAACVVMLIGERPGLSAADGLGAYLTWAPAPGRRDSERNCVSNIRAEGLAPDAAGFKLAWLLTEARRLGLTGVALKDDAPAALPPAAAPPPRIEGG